MPVPKPIEQVESITTSVPVSIVITAPTDTDGYMVKKEVSNGVGVTIVKSNTSFTLTPLEECDVIYEIIRMPGVTP